MHKNHLSYFWKLFKIFQTTILLASPSKNLGGLNVIRSSLETKRVYNFEKFFANAMALTSQYSPKTLLPPMPANRHPKIYKLRKKILPILSSAAVLGGLLFFFKHVHVSWWKPLKISFKKKALELDAPLTVFYEVLTINKISQKTPRTDREMVESDDEENLLHTPSR